MSILLPEEAIGAKNLKLQVRPEEKDTHPCGAFNPLPVAHPERKELQQVEQPTKKVNPALSFYDVGFAEIIIPLG